MKDIKVSIIVPVYNVEKYLEECLNSLEQQTYKNISVILINDGSTDRSKDIAEEYVNRNKNFVLINKKNGGLSSARNAGLEYSDGKYVLFLDSDDYLIESAIEELVIYSEENKLDVLKFVSYVFTDNDRELKWGKDIKDGYFYQGDYPEVYTGNQLLKKVISKDHSDAGLVSSCMIFTKREVITENNITFCEGILHEDNLFHLQLLTVSKRVAVLNKPLYCRRYREGSITTAPDYPKRIFSFLRSIEEANSFFNDYEVEKDIYQYYIKGFAINIIGDWNKLSTDEKKTQEMQMCKRRLKIIMKKNCFWKDIRLMAWYIHPHLYKVGQLLLEYICFE